MLNNQNKSDDRARKLISIISPFYNESLGVIAFHEAINRELELLVDLFDFEIICIDDGSEDDTLTKLIKISNLDSRFKIIELSRNFGKEAAITAGLDFAKGDAIIPIDADLQDPFSLIGKLISTWIETDADVVLAKRANRISDGLLKAYSAKAFYKIHNRLSDVRIPENVGDCRLITRRVVEALKLFPERQRFMKGLFAWVGFRTVAINFTREKRYAGSSKFSGWRLWNFAVEGITSFGSLPLRIWTYFGLTGALITFCYAFFMVLRTLIYGIDVPGYASLMVSILFFGSLQLIGLGILGEYIGRIYMESKNRPNYLVREVYQKLKEN